MDGIIDRIGLKVSTWLWFARTAQFDSDEFVSDLMSEVAPQAARRGEPARAEEVR